MKNRLVKRSNGDGEIQLLSGLICYHLLYPFSLFLSIPMKDLKKYRGGIQQGGYLFYFIGRGFVAMHAEHNGGIVLLPPERHYHPAPRAYFVGPLLGQGISEANLQRQRQYDVSKLLHRDDKDTTKQKRMRKTIPFSTLRSSIFLSDDVRKNDGQ